GHSAEKRRLSALADYAILDTAPEEGFDDIVAIASQICGAPITMISLVDSQRQWFKAARGMDVGETSREVAFGARTILDHSTSILPEAKDDDRFAANPPVTGAPFVRFHAGSPLITSTVETQGALCVVDGAPKELSPAQVAALEALSRQVVALLELRRVSSELAGALRTVRTLGQLLPICSHCKRIRDDRAYWQEVEQYLNTQVGTSFSHAVCPDCEALHYPSGAAPAGSRDEAGQPGEMSLG
ncbi:MAG: GAF domain-containing protein, partial [Gemmatimonadota bacterium]